METNHLIELFFSFHGSYRTYEEWKLLILEETWSILFVLTVPMRNGNSVGWRWFLCSSHRSYRTYEEWKLLIRSHIPRLLPQFLSYLWGMETSRGEERKMDSYVLTVPMRNGNFPIDIGWNLGTFSVLTAPMRNGNFRRRRRCKTL